MAHCKGESHVAFPSKNNVNTHYWSQNTSRNNDTKCYFSNGNYGEPVRVENVQNHKSSHKNNNAPNSSGKRYVSGQQNGRGKEKISNCTGERTAGAHSSSFPSLPPSLRESERMMNVQRWINSIPSDLPSWIQVSHDKIIPVKNPHQCFSEIEDPSVYEHADSLDPALHNDILDCSNNTIVDNVHREGNSTGQNMKYFDKRNNHSSNPTQTTTTTSLGLNHRGVSTGTHGVQPPPALPSQLSSSAQHGSTSNMNTSLGLVGSQFPNVSSGNSMNSHRNLLTPMKNYQSNQEIGISNHNQPHHLPYCIESDPNEGNYSSRHRVECETNNDYQNNNNNNNHNNNSNNTQQNQTGGSVKSNGRLFSDTEIQMIVKPSDI
ncbi:unnamed protein product [Trichobilharzia szidati]|nr:unnamed protein product [Trichobilharzia szidati]